MKKIILTLAIVLTGMFSVNAQEKTSQTDKILTEYTNVAQLTPDQVAKVRPMLDAFAADREANKQKYANDPDGLKVANKASRESYKAKLKNILSAEQIQKIDEYQKQKKERQEKTEQK